MPEIALTAVIMLAVLREIALEAISRFHSFKLHIPGLLIEINENECAENSSKG